MGSLELFLKTVREKNSGSLGKDGVACHWTVINIVAAENHLYLLSTRLRALPKYSKSWVWCLRRDGLHYHHYPGLCLWVRTWYEIALLIFSLWTSLPDLEQCFQESLSLSSCGKWQNSLKRRATWYFCPGCVKMGLVLPIYSEIGQREPTGMAEVVEKMLVWESRRDVLWLVSTNMSIISHWHVLLLLCWYCFVKTEALNKLWILSVGNCTKLKAAVLAVISSSDFIMPGTVVDAVREGSAWWMQWEMAL